MILYSIQVLNGRVQQLFIMEIEQFADQYKIHLLLGEGGQANVYLGSKNNQLYALKVYLPGASKEEAFKIEADFLSKLHFPHLINIVDSRLKANVKIGNNPEEKRALIVLELAEGGELFDFLSKQGAFCQEASRTYIKQLVAATKYLAEVGVSHRDLKPENILFDINFKLKVSDFGLSRDAKGEQGDFKLKSRVGTEGYKPPEMELGNYTGVQADIFATGVILFIMFNGTPPFLSTKPHDRIYKLIKDKNFQKFWALHERNKKPGHYSDPFKRLMNSFFSADPDRRPTFDSLENDEWMKGDEFMGNDLFDYMRVKAEKLFEKDENKQKMAAIKKDLYMNKAMEQEQCCEQSYRGEQEENLPAEIQFALNYKRLENVKLQDLQEYSKKKVVYIKQSPAFIVAWLKDHLATLFKEKETFMDGFVGDIVPTAFNIDFSEEKKQVNVKLSFTIDEEESTELELVGQLHRSEKGELGVEWSGVEGNDFWLNSVQNSMNTALQMIA